MSFWTSMTKDPKRQYRFVMNLSGLGVAGCKWFVKSVDKPNLSLSEASHEYLNHTFYYPGRASWNSVSVTLVDPASPDAAATMMAAMKAAGYQPPSSDSAVATISKSKAITALGAVTIQQIDGDGAAVEEWKLHNSWIKSVTLSGLDYSSDSLSEVTIEIRYDFAEMTVHGGAENTVGPVTAGTSIFGLTPTTTSG